MNYRVRRLPLELWKNVIDWEDVRLNLCHNFYFRLYEELSLERIAVRAESCVKESFGKLSSSLVKRKCQLVELRRGRAKATKKPQVLNSCLHHTSK